MISAADIGAFTGGDEDVIRDFDVGNCISETNIGSCTILKIVTANRDIFDVTGVVNVVIVQVATVVDEVANIGKLRLKRPHNARRSHHN